MILCIEKMRNKSQISLTRNEPRHEKTGFLHMRKKKSQISFAVTAKMISAFVFATLIEQSLCFLNIKFQASSHIVWFYSLVCAGPGRTPRRPVFSQRGSNVLIIWTVKVIAKLICAFVFAYAKSRFSHDAAHLPSCP